MNNSISTSPDLYLTPAGNEKADIESRIRSAVREAARAEFFSTLDVYREMGYHPGGSHKWYNKTAEVPPHLIRKVMKEMGVQSVIKQSKRAHTCRWYLPLTAKGLLETAEAAL